MRATCGVYEAAWLARLHAVSAHSLYLHLPFCVRKCAYCDFSSWETSRSDPLMDAYVAALERQLEAARTQGLLSGTRTAFLGGGTPTMLGAELLGRLVRAVRRSAPDLDELTCEANPESLSNEVIETLVEAGATRLSIGVQSLDDTELAALGRLHDAQTACEHVTRALGYGVDVSCDLMCAIPHQTAESWRRTLERMVSLGVGHVSVYPLQIEEGTPLAERVGGDEPFWNDPDVQAERMQDAARVLGEAGYERYEVASYAKPGKDCRHNQAYWTGLPYLGLGTAASSMLTAEGYQRLQGVWPELPEAPEGATRVRLTVTSDRWTLAECVAFDGLRAELELLDACHTAAEDMMLGLRRSAGLHPGLLAHARAVLGGRVDEAVGSCERRGLATWRDGRLAPTHPGWLLGNELYGAFWDLSEGEIRTASC